MFHRTLHESSFLFSIPAGDNLVKIALPMWMLIVFLQDHLNPLGLPLINEGVMIRSESNSGGSSINRVKGFIPHRGIPHKKVKVVVFEYNKQWHFHELFVGDLGNARDSVIFKDISWISLNKILHFLLPFKNINSIFQLIKEHLWQPDKHLLNFYFGNH